MQPGRLAVLDRNGTFLGALGTTATVNGPWAMAIHDTGNGVSGTANVFLSNVLSGVVSRLDTTYGATTLSATATVLANGFNHRLDPAALVLGPSGLAYDATRDTLFVASSADNAIYEIPTAAKTQTTVSAELLFQDLVHLQAPWTWKSCRTVTYWLPTAMAQMPIPISPVNSLNTPQQASFWRRCPAILMMEALSVL